MKCSKCGQECYAKSSDYISARVVSICCGAEIVDYSLQGCNHSGQVTDGTSGEDSRTDWKELEIGNIPSDFKENDNYILQVKNLGDKWIDEEVTDKEDRTRILHYVIDGDFEYRYKLKPLESIRITQNELEILCDYYGAIEADTDYLADKIGRKVKLID